MQTPRTLGLAAALILLIAAPAAAKPPSAPPEVLVAPTEKANEKTPVTFRIRAAAGDVDKGHWAVILEAGNFEQLELEQTSDPTVYERTVKLHNARAFAAQVRDTRIPDFDAPRVSARLFPPEVTWRVAFFPTGHRSPAGTRATRTAKATFGLEHTYERRDYTNEPGLPSFPTRRIVLHRSIGGVALGDRRTRVLRRLGEPFFGTDFYFNRIAVSGRGTVTDGQPRTEGDSASVDFDQHSAAIVAIYASDGGGLRKLRTDKGIHLGSTRRDVERAYRRAQPFEKENGGLAGYFVDGPGLTQTVFGLSRGKVDQIVVR
jgi:hypothetical protein